jgi:hypothetical protein
VCLSGCCRERSLAAHLRHGALFFPFTLFSFLFVYFVSSSVFNAFDVSCRFFGTRPPEGAIYLNIKRFTACLAVRPLYILAFSLFLLGAASLFCFSKKKKKAAISPVRVSTRTHTDTHVQL